MLAAFYIRARLDVSEPKLAEEQENVPSRPARQNPPSEKDVADLVAEPAVLESATKTASVYGDVLDNIGDPVTQVQLGLFQGRDRSSYSLPNEMADAIQTTLPDKAGRYEFNVVMAGQYVIQCNLMSEASYYELTDFSYSPIVVLDDGRTLSGVDFVYGKGVTVSGHIIDSAGVPIPGAEVRFRSENGQREVKTGLSNAPGGDFSVPGIQPGTEVSYHVRAEGYVSPLDRPRSLEIPYGSGVDGLVIVMQKPAVFTGYLVDPNGAPVSATIALNGKCGHGHATSDKEGYFRLENIIEGPCFTRIYPPHTYLMSADHGYPHEPGMFHFVPGETKGPVTITVEPYDWPAISGVVQRPDGTPVPEAHVSAATHSCTGYFTDENGRFELRCGEELTPTDLGVALHDIKGMLLKKAVPVGKTDLVIVLPEAGRIRCTFRSAGDSKVPAGFQYKLRQQIQHVHYHPIPYSGSVFAADGIFGISNIMPGSYTLEISAKGYAMQRFSNVEVQPDETTQIDIEMSESVPVSGTVIAANDRSPIRNARVKAAAPDGHIAASTSTNTEGRFAFESLAAGIWLIRVVPERDYLAQEREIRIGAAGVSNLHFVLNLATIIHGHITRGGVPLPDARIQIQPRLREYDGEAMMNLQLTHTNTDGYYEFDQVNPGSYTWVLMVDEFVKKEIEVNAGYAFEMNYDL